MIRQSRQFGLCFGIHQLGMMQLVSKTGMPVMHLLAFPDQFALVFQLPLPAAFQPICFLFRPQACVLLPLQFGFRFMREPQRLFSLRTCIVCLSPDLLQRFVQAVPFFTPSICEKLHLLAREKGNEAFGSYLDSLMQRYGDNSRLMQSIE